MPVTSRSNSFTQRLQLQVPIIQGPFGGGLSSIALAAAISNAGGLGSFGAHHLDDQAITELIRALRTATAKPFAINLWVPQSYEPTDVAQSLFEEAADRLGPLFERFGLTKPHWPETGRVKYGQDFEKQVRSALDACPPVLSFVMNVPPVEVIDEAHARGIVVIATATTVDEALVLERVGVDVIVASGSDAGGHRGSFLRPVDESLVGTMSLVPQVADAVKIPVVAAGGIADGRGMAAALVLGAAGVQIGTAFLMCEESGASQAHRAVLASERARTTMLTRAFSGRLARGIPNVFLRDIRAVESLLPSYPIWNWFTQPLRKAAAARGDAEYLSLWSGQSARLAKVTHAADLIQQIMSDAEQCIATFK